MTMLTIRCVGPRACQLVLASVLDAESQGVVATDQMLADALGDDVSRLTVHRVLWALAQTGLITREPSEIVITASHLWIASEIRLTEAGRAVIDCQAGGDMDRDRRPSGSAQLSSRLHLAFAAAHNRTLTGPIRRRCHAQ